MRHLGFLISMQNKAEQPVGTQQRRFQGAINLGGYNWEQAGSTGSTHGSNHPLRGEKKKVPLGNEKRNWAGKEHDSVISRALASLHEDKYSYEMCP